MYRTAKDRVLFDLFIGVFSGIIARLSWTLYSVIIGLALVGILIMLIRREDMSTYGHDKDGKFNGLIVITRIITVNVGVALGHLVIGHSVVDFSTF
ncbi:hypothetical protein HN670_03325 [bacterium]|jgi:hypothetical protein|nr:hypothetical protein [bacterium]